MSCLRSPWPDPCSIPDPPGHSTGCGQLPSLHRRRSWISVREAQWLLLPWAKCEETWECDKFPRARTPFERALYVRTTPFASVGDILEAVGEEDRRISLLQFGQISIVGTTEHASLVLMMFPFARRNVGASEEAHPGVGACQSEKQELRRPRKHPY